jgi:nicotinamidase-related amidase
VQHCLKQECKGRPFVAQLLPSANHYSLLKPKHSAFCQTPLEILLKHLGCQRVILSGFSTNSCVLFTANDAYMRDLEIVVPQNCVAACNTEDQLARRRCHESPPDLNVGRRPQLYGDSGTLADDSAYYLSVEEAFSGG